MACLQIEGPSFTKPCAGVSLLVGAGRTAMNCSTAKVREGIVQLGLQCYLCNEFRQPLALNEPYGCPSSCQGSVLVPWQRGLTWSYLGELWTRARLNSRPAAIFLRHTLCTQGLLGFEPAWLRTCLCSEGRVVGRFPAAPSRVR